MELKYEYSYKDDLLEYLSRITIIALVHRESNNFTVYEDFFNSDTSSNSEVVDTSF